MVTGVSSKVMFLNSAVSLRGCCVGVGGNWEVVQVVFQDDGIATRWLN